MLGKYCCPFCLWNDQQDSCWVLLTTIGWETLLPLRGAMSPVTLPMSVSSTWAGTEVTLPRDLCHSNGWYSRTLLVSTKLMLCGILFLLFQSRVKGLLFSHCCLLSGAFFSSAAGACWAQDREPHSSEILCSAIQHEGSLDPSSSFVKDEAQRSWQQVVQCLPNSSNSHLPSACSKRRGWTWRWLSWEQQ